MNRAVPTFRGKLVTEIFTVKMLSLSTTFILTILGMTPALVSSVPVNAKVPVYVPVGGPAFLYCQFDLTPEGEIPDDLVVHWSKDTKVMLYHVRKPHPATYYAPWVDKDRVSFSEATMRVGVVEVVIYPTKKEDTGLYVCTILGVEKPHMETTQLIVEDAPKKRTHESINNS